MENKKTLIIRVLFTGIVLLSLMCVSAHRKVKADEAAPNFLDENMVEPEEKALEVLQGLNPMTETTIANETAIVDENGIEFGKVFDYKVGGESYGYAVYDENIGRITQFIYKKGQDSLIKCLKERAEKDGINMSNSMPVLIANKNNPYSINIVKKDGNAMDIFGRRKKYSSSIMSKLVTQLKMSFKNNLNLSVYGINAKVDYPFFKYGQLKKFVKNRYGRKMYKGYKAEYLKTFNQGNVQSNTGNKYACGVVAATFDLAMQNRIYKSTWNTYNEIYKNANVENGGTYGDSVAKSLNKYYKRYYKSNGFKAYFKDTKVRFASIKKCVDSNYKSILDLFVKKSGHAVPVLGYYSYFFDSQNAVDYVIISTDWYDDCEMYFDSVYLNAGEMDSEAELIYMKPYNY